MNASASTAPSGCQGPIVPVARPTSPLVLAALGVAVFLAAWSCIVLVQHSGRITTIWIANAIILAVLLKHPGRDWARIVGVALAANLAANLFSGDGLVGAACLPLINILEVLCVALPLRWLGLDLGFSRSEVLLTFYGLVVAACGLSALAAATAMYLLARDGFWHIWGIWFGADALGLSLLVPFLMCVRPSTFLGMFASGQRFLTAVLLGAVFGVGALCYAFPTWPLSFLFMPVLILLTFRRGFAGGALGLFIAVVISFWLVLSPHVSANMATHTASERIAVIQFYYAVIGFTIILAGAALEERRGLERSLAVAARKAEASREDAVLARAVAEKASNAKSSFLANMSHELRTPLNAVLGFSEIIGGEMFGPVGDARYREYAALINSAGTHLLDLIGDILDMSKIEAGKHELHRERFPIAGLAAECVELMADRAAAGGVVLTADVTNAPRAVLADRRAIKQILLNLLSNAVKFTPAGGAIVLTVEAVGAACRLAVADTGIGMPAGEMDRVGNPFVQLSNNSGRHPGTGLGLALVRGLADLHGGTFKIDSAEGRGTTATVILPDEAAAAGAATA